MTRDKLITHIKERLKREHDISVDREAIGKILAIEEDEIYQVIALNDSYKYLWGTISGVSRKPTRITGHFSEYRSVKDNHGYSTWKNGCPTIKWSKESKIYDTHPPEEYFAQPEIRYTTEAREFRKIAGLPEIPEFETLSEEKILEICAKADKIQEDKIPLKVRKQRERDKKRNDERLALVHEKWRQTNYKPMGSKLEEFQDRSKRITLVDQYLDKKIKEDTPLDWEMHLLLKAKDLADLLEETERMPEILQRIEICKAKMDEQGIKMIPHKSIQDRGQHYGTYNENGDTWDIKEHTSWEYNNARRKEHADREMKDVIEILMKEHKIYEDKILEYDNKQKQTKKRELAIQENNSDREQPVDEEQEAMDMPMVEPTTETE